MTLLDSGRTSLFHTIKGKPRAGIGARNDINPWLVEEFTGEDIATVAVMINNKVVYLSSVYLDINLPVRNPSLVAMVEKANRKAIPLLIGLDTNAHSSLWGSENSNSRGEEMEDMILEHNLFILNEGSRPTFRTNRASTIIDVTLVNQEAMQTLGIADWKVEETESLSDHKYISFHCATIEPITERKRNFRKADWSAFSTTTSVATILSKWEDANNGETSAVLNKLASTLYEVIEKGLDRACPPKRPVAHKRPNNWWTSDLDKLRGELRRLGTRKHKSPLHFARFVEARRKYKNAIDEARKDSWRNFITKVEGAKDISSLVKTLEGRPRRRISLLQCEGSYTSTPEETVDLLLKTHFPNHNELDESKIEAGGKNNPDDGPSEMEKYITLMRIKAAFDSFGSHKAPGPDELPPIALKNLGSEALLLVEQIYKLSIRNAVVPDRWRQMKVVFIPKVGKEDYSQPKAYRPITLSNFLLKGLERIIHWFLTDHVLHPLTSQYAYTRDRSTETALSDVVDYIERAVHNRQSALAVSLDCSGAFDCIKFDSAIEAMESKNISTDIISWYDTMLRNRKVSAGLQGVSKTITPTQGSPQGGILSPLVWNLVMDSLLTKLQPHAVKAVGYADDVILIATGFDTSTLQQLMQDALSTVSDWSLKHGLKFNPQKTTVVMFNKARKFQTPQPKLYLGGTELFYSDSVKYLGVTIQKRLSWTTHLKDRTRKCFGLLQRLRTVVGREWGLSPEKLLYIYTAVIRPRLAYASAVWAHSINITAVKRLDRIQAMILRAVSRAQRSTPLAAMEAAVGLQPLDLFLREEATRSRSRTRQILPTRWDGVSHNATSASLVGHQRVLDNTLNKLIDPNLPLEEGETMNNWTANGTTSSPDLVVYTDGSKMHRTGYGWLVTKGDQIIAEESGHLHTATITQAELTAIQCALRWLIENPKPPRQQVLLLSDSKAALQSLFAQKTKNKLALETSRLITECQRHFVLELRWVKAHNNNTGNEAADYLAKRGANLPTPLTPPALPLSRSEVKNRIKEHFTNVWQSRWKNLNGCATAKSILPIISERVRYDKVKLLGRNSLNILIQGISGHGMFAGHLSKWRDIPPECSLCKEEAETALHLFNRCPALELERKQLPHSIECYDVLNFFQSSRIKRLMASNARRLDNEDEPRTYSQRTGRAGSYRH